MDKLDKQRQIEERAAKSKTRAEARAKMHSDIQAARLARAKLMYEVMLRLILNRKSVRPCPSPLIMSTCIEFSIVHFFSHLPDLRKELQRSLTLLPILSVIFPT